MGAGSSASRSLKDPAVIARKEKRAERRAKRKNKHNDPNLEAAAPDAALRASQARGDAVSFPTSIQIASTRVFGGSRSRATEEQRAIELPVPVSIMLCKIRRVEYCANERWHCAVKRVSIKPNRNEKMIYLKAGRGRQAPVVKLSTDDSHIAETLSLLSRLAALCDTSRIRHNLWRHLAEYEANAGAFSALFDQAPRKERICDDCTLAYSATAIFCPVTKLLHPPQFWQPEEEPAAAPAPASPFGFPRPQSNLPHWQDATALPAGLERSGTVARSCLARRKAGKRLSSIVLEGMAPVSGYGAAGAAPSPTSSTTSRTDMSVDMGINGSIVLMTPLRLEWYDERSQWKCGILGVALLAPFEQRRVRLTTCEGSNHVITCADDDEFRAILPSLGRLADAGCVSHDIWTGNHHSGWLCPACLFCNPAVHKTAAQLESQGNLKRSGATTADADVTSPQASPRSSGSFGERHCAVNCQMCGTKKPSLPQGIAAGSLRLQRSHSARPTRPATFTPRAGSPVAGMRRIHSIGGGPLMSVHDVVSCSSGGSVGNEQDMSEDEDEEEWDVEESEFSDSDTEIADTEDTSDYESTCESPQNATAAARRRISSASPDRKLTELCSRCNKLPCTTVLIPCRHLCLCACCATDAGKCPICSEMVTHNLQVWV